jgi:hypothetical protein
MKNPLRLALLLLVLNTLSGCASISLVNSWKDPGVTAKKYHKLLIVGIAEKPPMRKVFEEVFASELVKKGVTGIPSYTITGVKEKPTRASLEEAVGKSGADGVITTRVTSIKKDKDTQTGFIMTEHGFADAYGVPVNYATFVHQSVEVTTSTNAAIETNLFDRESGLLVWSGTSSVVNPEGIITISQELADLVFKAMAKDGLI